LYLTLGGVTPSSYRHKGGHDKPAKAEPMQYAVEKPMPVSRLVISAPTPRSTPTLDQRRAANAKELQQLRAWGEQLRLRKRDLVRSDTQGNRFYAIDLALYNDALAKATAEQKALAAER
jgi:hypothetical protein